MAVSIRQLKRIDIVASYLDVTCGVVIEKFVDINTHEVLVCVTTDVRFFEDERWYLYPRIDPQILYLIEWLKLRGSMISQSPEDISAYLLLAVKFATRDLGYICRYYDQHPINLIEEHEVPDDFSDEKISDIIPNWDISEII